MKDFIQDFCQTMRLRNEEAAVISAVSRGLISHSQIAKELEFSSSKIEDVMSSVFAKCLVNSIGELVSFLLSFSSARSATCLHFHRRPTVLVLDDEPAICEIIKDFIESKGARCMTYSKVQQAELAFPYIQPDVIITDYNMPGMTGLEWIRSLRNRYISIPPVIVLRLNKEILTLGNFLKRGPSLCFQNLLITKDFSNAFKIVTAIPPKDMITLSPLLP